MCPENTISLMSTSSSTIETMSSIGTNSALKGRVNKKGKHNVS